VCNQTNDRAACYHVARQYENTGQYEQAITFFSRAQAYGNAVRLCKVSTLMNMAAVINYKPLKSIFTIFLSQAEW